MTEAHKATLIRLWQIRAQLSAIGMNTHGSREKLVFRHKSVLNAALAELDALKMGRPLRSKEEIFREVSSVINSSKNMLEPCVIGVCFLKIASLRVRVCAGG